MLKAQLSVAPSKKKRIENQTDILTKYYFWINRRKADYTLPIRVCAAQRGHDFEAPDSERGIHFRGVF